MQVHSSILILIAVPAKHIDTDLLRQQEIVLRSGSSHLSEIINGHRAAGVSQ